jgi:hypothetical protein
VVLVMVIPVLAGADHRTDYREVRRVPTPRSLTPATTLGPIRAAWLPAHTARVRLTQAPR